MTQEQATLRAFVAEKLAGQGLEADENVFRALAAAVTLEEGDPREEDETRSVYLKQQTDGTHTAESIKLYNLMKVSTHDLSGFLLKEATIFLSGDAKIKVILSLLNLLHEFYPKLTYTFNEQDAQLLLTIFEWNRPRFTAAGIAEQHAARFEKRLPEDAVARSFNLFTDLRVLKYLGDGQYERRENIIYERH